jgi:hypothetical protein
MAASVGTITSWSSTSFAAAPSSSVTIDTTCSVYIVVVHSLSNRVLPSACTIGGISATQLYTFNGSNERITFFGLENPPTGTKTVAFTSASDWFGFVGYSLIGTDVTTAGGYVGSTAGSNGSSNTVATVALSYTPNGIVLNGAGNFQGTFTTANAGESTGFNGTATGDANRDFASGHIYKSAGTSITTGWNCNSGGTLPTVGAIFVKEGAGRTPDIKPRITLINQSVKRAALY